MKYEEIKKGQKVYDTWWPHRIGIVTRIYKKTVHIKFDDKNDIYDLDHIQFLKKFKKLTK